MGVLCTSLAILYFQGMISSFFREYNMLQGSGVKYQIQRYHKKMCVCFPRTKLFSHIFCQKLYSIPATKLSVDGIAGQQFIPGI